MSDLRNGLDRILSLCYTSRQYTRRTQQIHEEAMKALGLTQSQREGRHEAIFARLGDNAGKTAFENREARRKALQWDVPAPVKLRFDAIHLHRQSDYQFEVRFVLNGETLLTHPAIIAPKDTMIIGNIDLFMTGNLES